MATFRVVPKMTKLYLLAMTGRSKQDSRAQSGEVIESQVVRAKDARAARKVAANCCRDEGGEFWLNPLYSTCRRIRETGEPDIVLQHSLTYNPVNRFGERT